SPGAVLRQEPAARHSGAGPAVRARGPGQIMVPGWVMSRCPASAEGVAMSDQASAPGGSGGAGESGPEAAAEDQGAGLSRRGVGMQERHGEGGIDPARDDADPDAGPGA